MIAAGVVQDGFAEGWPSPSSQSRQSLSLARASGLGGGWVQLFHAGHARATAEIRPAGWSAKGLRFPGRKDCEHVLLGYRSG